MRIISKRTLREFWEKHRDCEQSLLIWYKEVYKNKFLNSQEIKENFPNCRPIGNFRFIFNIKGNNYRLIVKISFELQTVWIKFIGTHNDYNKIDPNKI